LDHAGMPFGIQILSAPGNDRLVAEVAKALEIVLADNTATKRPVPDLSKLQT
jgi:Asp-tRNA(Asn)/Glu-tRNA(Gln) amidotransferase A subunit family amidase